MSKTPSLQVNKPSESTNDEASDFIKKGYDLPPEDDTSPKKTTFSVALDKDYYRLLEKVSATLSEQVGVKVSMRSVASRGVREFLKNQAALLGIDDKAK